MKITAFGKQVFGKWILILCSLGVASLLAGCGTPAGQTDANFYYQLSGSGKPGELTIQRIELGFVKGARSITVSKGQKILPKAQIKFQGTGVLSANWMVDDQIVEQLNISLSHGSLLTLSPKNSTRIPSFVMGRHSLQLKINHPDVDFTQPKLSYFVVNN